MKALIEKRAKLMAELDAIDADIETRSVTQEDVHTMKEKIAEVKQIDAQLEQVKEIRNLKNTKEMKVEETNMELRTRVLNGEEIRTVIGNTTATTGGMTVANGELVVQNRPSNGILKYARLQNVKGTEIIPVQKAPMTELVPMNELEEMAKASMNVGNVNLEPTPHGMIVPVSNTVLDKSSFDFGGFVKEQGQIAIEKCIAGKMIAIMNGATAGSVARETVGVLTYQDIVNLYLGLKQEYRDNAVFVANDADLKALMGLVDTTGAPILVRDITTAYGFTLFGRPVVQDDRATKLVFANIEKAMAVACGEEAQVKKSEDALFMSNATAFRIVVDVDVKATIEDALVFLG